MRCRFRQRIETTPDVFDTVILTQLVYFDADGIKPYPAIFGSDWFFGANKVPYRVVLSG